MSDSSPTERVAAVLAGAGYRRMLVPLKIAGLDFDVAAAFVGAGLSADLIVVADIAAASERNVVQQIEGIARALDVVRSFRPLTTVIVGPRPVGKAQASLTQVGRLLAVEEANDPGDLHDRLSVLLPIILPANVGVDDDLRAGEEFELPPGPLAAELYEASRLGEAAVRDCFHTALSDALSPIGEPSDGTDGDAT